MNILSCIGIMDDPLQKRENFAISLRQKKKKQILAIKR